MIASSTQSRLRLADYVRPMVPVMISAVTLSLFAPALLAQNGTNDNTQARAPGIFEKAPYSMIMAEGGGGIFSPRNSSASAPTQICPGGFISTNQHYNCAEQFARAASGGFGMGVRPIRYLQVGLRADVLGNFNGYQPGTTPVVCVSGCTGTFNAAITTLSGLVTADAQAVLPLFREHLLISAGGGLGWLEVRSRAQTGNVQVPGACPNCPPPQGGHGPTEVAEIMYFPDRHFGIGLQFRNVQISSPGLSSVGGPLFGPVTYKDRFFLIGGQISIRFGRRD